MNSAMQTGGVDTAHVSLWIQWDSMQFWMNVGQWQAAQKIGREGHLDANGEEDVYDERTAGFAAGPHVFDVLPYGFNAGDSKYTYFPYVLVCDGIRFCFSEREYRDTTSTPNARVEIGSLPLMMWGLPECWRRVKDALACMGGKLERDHLSRIDVCVDLPGVPVDTFQLAVWENRYVTRAKKFAFHDVYLADEESAPVERCFHKSGRIRTGVTIGKSKILCRIYEKLIESTHREDKLAILSARRWGGSIPDCASRIEFQLRNDALDSLSVNAKCGAIQSVADWLLCQADVCRYLCRSWLRLYRRTFDSRHTERLSDDDLLPAWKRVIDAFECWTGRGDDAAVKRDTKPLRIDALALIREGFGCIRSAFVRCGIHFDRQDPSWREQFFGLAVRAFKRVLRIDGEARFMQRQRDAECKLDAALPWTPVSALV